MKSLMTLCLTLLLSLWINCASALPAGVTITKTDWPGERWEYLVENPHYNHIDAAHFEHILDTAGHDGWELVEVTSFNHFYTFYFKRPLMPHKYEAHVVRLNRNKSKFDAKAAEKRKLIETTLNKNK